MDLRKWSGQAQAVNFSTFQSGLSLVLSALSQCSYPLSFFPQGAVLLQKAGTAYDGKNLVVIEMMRKLRVDLSCESGLWNVVGGSIARPFHIQPSPEY